MFEQDNLFEQLRLTALVIASSEEQARGPMFEVCDALLDSVLDTGALAVRQLVLFDDH